MFVGLNHEGQKEERWVSVSEFFERFKDRLESALKGYNRIEIEKKLIKIWKELKVTPIGQRRKGARRLRYWEVPSELIMQLQNDEADEPSFNEEEDPIWTEGWNIKPETATEEILPKLPKHLN